MNTFLKYVIIYLELFLLVIYFSITAPAEVDFTGSVNQDSIPTITKNNFLSKVIYINNLNRVKEERTAQVKTKDLFLVNSLPLVKCKSCYIIILNQLAINRAVPDYLLSSDLKSPPQYL